MPVRPPRHRGIYLLPNLFTTAAMFAGFYAIVVSIDGRPVGDGKPGPVTTSLRGAYHQHADIR